MRVEVDGIEEMERALAEAAQKLHAEFERATAESAESLAETARSFAPVDSGRLSSSIEVGSEGTEATIGTDVEYAAYVEFGTSKMPATPYLTPASEIERARFVERMKDAGKAVG